MTRCLAVLLSSFADVYVRPDRSSPLAEVWLSVFPASKHGIDGFDFVLLESKASVPLFVLS